MSKIAPPDRRSTGFQTHLERLFMPGRSVWIYAGARPNPEKEEALKARGIWTVGYDATGPERWDAVDLRRPVARRFASRKGAGWSAGSGACRMTRSSTLSMSAAISSRASMYGSTIRGGHWKHQGPAARRLFSMAD